VSAPLFRTLASLIPWTDIVKATPSIISAARGAFDGRGIKSEPVVTNADRINETTLPLDAIDLLREDVTVLRNAITDLQEENARKTRILRDIAEQNNRLTESLRVTQLRLRLAVIFTLVVFAASLAAIWLAVR